MPPAGHLLRTLRDLVVPSTCAGCGMPGAAVCSRCLDAMAPLGVVGCARCGHPWPAAVPACPECPAGVAWARQAMAYDHLAARVIGALKDQHRRDVGECLGQMLGRRVPRPHGRPLLVPIPLAPGRAAERGFNQAEVIARALEREWDLPVRLALARADGALHQRGASRGARHVQVGGAFTAVGRVPFDAVLVDDVVTTGATLVSAARALRRVGCARVRAVAAARVVAGAGAWPPARLAGA